MRGGGAARRVFGEGVAERTSNASRSSSCRTWAAGENERRHAGNLGGQRESPEADFASHACGRRRALAAFFQPPIPSSRFPIPHPCNAFRGNATATSDCSRSASRTLASPSRGRGSQPRIDAALRKLERRGSRAAAAHLAVGGMVLATAACPASRFRSTSRIRVSFDSSGSQMLDVEGGTRDECTRIMRHETGHAIQHGYQLHRRREVAARSSANHRRTLPRVLSAESRRASATCSTCASGTRRAIPMKTSPRRSRCGSSRASDWRTRYAGWPALKKLEYVDELMSEICDQKPLVATRQRIEPVIEAHENAGAALRVASREVHGEVSEHVRSRTCGASSPTRRASPSADGGELPSS